MTTQQVFDRIVEYSTIPIVKEQEAVLSSYIPISDLRDVIFDYMKEIDREKLTDLIVANYAKHPGLARMAGQHYLTRDLRIGCVIL